MPTAAKLVAAILFAALGFGVAEIYKTTITERTVWGYLSEVSAFMGLVWGWRVSGRLAGAGYWAGIGFGARTVVTVFFWVILTFAIYVMVIQSTRKIYGDPMEALLGAGGLMLDFSRSILTVDVLVPAFAGGILAGVIVEFVSRRWP